MEEEVERIRTCIASSRPCGSEEWQNRQAEDLGWWHTLRREGRPTKQTAKHKNSLRSRCDSRRNRVPPVRPRLPARLVHQLVSGVSAIPARRNCNSSHNLVRFHESRRLIMLGAPQLSQNPTVFWPTLPSSGLTGVALRLWHCLRERRCKTDIRFDCDFGQRQDFLTLSAL
jgi:hypothetical protein